jgi:negative regulator of sigma E activity
VRRIGEVIVEFKKFNEAAELVGIAAVVASLVFVGIQMKQASDIAQNEVTLGVFATSIEINNEMIEYADIWVRGSRGDELDETEAFIFGGLMQNLNNEAFFARSMRAQLGDSEARSNEVHILARILHENPGARQTWMEWQSAYQPYRALKQVPFESESFSDQVREALKLMDEM